MIVDWGSCAEGRVEFKAELADQKTGEVVAFAELAGATVAGLSANPVRGASAAVQPLPSLCTALLCHPAQFSLLRRAHRSHWARLSPGGPSYPTPCRSSLPTA